MRPRFTERSSPRVLCSAAVLLACHASPPPPAEPSGGTPRAVEPAVADAGPRGPRIVQVAVAGEHSCALIEDGRVRCWGRGSAGALGYGRVEDIGDDELPTSAGDVSVGGAALALALGPSNTCVILEDGMVRCWGSGDNGVLGLAEVDPLGGLQTIGDDELPSSVAALDFGQPVASLAVTSARACAVTEGGQLWCWGNGAEGALGLPGWGEMKLGDDELPTSAGPVDVGGVVVDIALAGGDSCVLLDDHSVRCWGPTVTDQDCGRCRDDARCCIGDDELPASAPAFRLEPPIERLVGHGMFCAVLDGGGSRCWWRPSLGHAVGVGDVGPPATELTDIAWGFSVEQLAASHGRTCAVSELGQLRCWVRRVESRMPRRERLVWADIAAGGPVQSVAVAEAGEHACALLESGRVRCWGVGRRGQLGYGDTNDVPDEAGLAELGDVVVLAPRPLIGD